MRGCRTVCQKVFNLLVGGRTFGGHFSTKNGHHFLKDDKNAQTPNHCSKKSKTKKHSMQSCKQSLKLNYLHITTIALAILEDSHRHKVLPFGSNIFLFLAVSQPQLEAISMIFFPCFFVFPSMNDRNYYVGTQLYSIDFIPTYLSKQVLLVNFIIRFVCIYYVAI